MFSCGFSFEFFFNQYQCTLSRYIIMQAGRQAKINSFALISQDQLHFSWLDAAQARFVEVVAMQSPSNKLEVKLETELRGIAQEM